MALISFQTEQPPSADEGHKTHLKVLEEIYQVEICVVKMLVYERLHL